MSRLSLIALAAAAVLGLSACGADSDDTSATEETTAEETTAAEDTAAEDGEEAEGDVVETITVSAQEMSFTGIPETLPAGTVQIDFENAGEAPHDLVIEELGDEQVIPMIDAGASESGTVTLEPGTYTFYCSVGTHRQMGMEATVTVE